MASEKLPSFDNSRLFKMFDKYEGPYAILMIKKNCNTLKKQTNEKDHSLVLHFDKISVFKSFETPCLLAHNFFSMHFSNHNV